MINKRDFLKNIKLLKDCNGLEVGTKAKNIKIIKEKGGCKIPKTLVIIVDVFRQLINENKILDPANYDWSKFQIPTKYQKIILERIKKEFGDKALVIRSSATCEDSPLLSFAGQYSSFLNIKSDKNILKAINLCYRSLFSENAKIYAKLNGVRLEYESMAIAIQELFIPTVAGVVFTANPVDQDDKQIVIEYTEGLGDSVVSGHKKPIVKKIAKSEIENLKEIFLKKLVEKALILEKVFGNHQDIEWGWDGKEICIFQSRNITTMDKHPQEINISIDKNKVIGTGDIACRGISSGSLKVIDDIKDYDKIKKGDVVFLNCKMDILLVKEIASINALIINGGILSHIAVIAREFNIPSLLEPKMKKGKIEDYKDKKIIIDALKGQIILN